MHYVGANLGENWVKIGDTLIGYKRKKLNSLKLSVRTTWWTQTSKTSKIFWQPKTGLCKGGPYKL